MEFDSILYIVITLVILVISGLSSRKKKQIQMAEAEAKSKARQKEDSYEVEDKYDEKDSYNLEEADDYEEAPLSTNIFETLRSASSPFLKQSSNPFERMEQILTGQDPRIKSMEGESMEGESLEDTVDEEEQILEDIRKRNEPEPEPEPTKVSEFEAGIDSTQAYEKKSEILSELFKDVDEIKKAIIYSEILNRKY